MRSREMKRMLVLISGLTAAQRLVLLQDLREQTEGAQALEVVQSRMGMSPTCPHCRGNRVVRNCQACGCRRTSRHRRCWGWSRRTRPISCVPAKASGRRAAPDAGVAAARPSAVYPTNKSLCWWPATAQAQRLTSLCRG